MIDSRLSPTSGLSRAGLLLGGVIVLPAAVRGDLPQKLQGQLRNRSAEPGLDFEDESISATEGLLNLISERTLTN